MNNEKLLKDQIALVTGASSGIGKGIAKRLADAGAKVVVNYASSDAQAQQVVNDIKNAGGEAVTVRADVSKEEDVFSMFTKVFEEYGTLDILVNNAGVGIQGPFEGITFEDWDFG